jgi:hypothetical protein
MTTKKSQFEQKLINKIENLKRPYRPNIYDKASLEQNFRWKFGVLIIAYINSLKVGEALNEKEIREGYQAFTAQKAAEVLRNIAEKHGLQTEALQSFVDTIMNRMIFDGEQFTDLLAQLELGWKARGRAGIDGRSDVLSAQAGGRARDFGVECV